MKIIDNKKDYYDYLQGIYGQDPKAIYDRRGSFAFVKEYLPDIFRNDQLFSKENFGILGYIGHIYVIAGRKVFVISYYNNLKQKLIKLIGSRDIIRETEIPLILNFYNVSSIQSNSPIKGSEDLYTPYFLNNTNHLYEHDIVGYSKKYRIDNPILQSIGLTCIPADEIFLSIQDFLLSLNEKETIDDRTDIQKIESAGFDKKISFKNCK